MMQSSKLKVSIDNLEDTLSTLVIASWYMTLRARGVLTGTAQYRGAHGG
jgi:hypothetical protein